MDGLLGQQETALTDGDGNWCELGTRYYNGGAIHDTFAQRGPHGSGPGANSE
ncbi:MAG: hypothetical protein WBX00_29075 [Isosphaeraceae bacterium]